MTKRILSALFIIICLIRISNGQIPSNLRDFYDEFRRSKHENEFTEKTEIKGSPYENSEFVEGDIYTAGNRHYTGIPLRYNIFSNKVEFRNPEGEILEISPAEIVDSVFISGSKYIYYTFRAGSKIQKSFFRVLTGHEPELLLKMNVIFKEAEPPGGYKDAVPATFERLQDDFYLLFPSAEAVKFSGKKEFLELFPAQQAVLDKFIRQNKTRFGKSEDIVNLMEYLYSLGK